MHLWGKKCSQLRAKAEMSGVTVFKSSVLLPPIGYLLGGHVMRLFHGHDEVVAIPGSDQSEEQQRCGKKKWTNKQTRLHRSIRGHTLVMAKRWCSTREVYWPVTYRWFLSSTSLHKNASDQWQSALWGAKMAAVLFLSSV